MPPSFAIAAAQIPSVRGDLRRNIERHAAAIRAAAAHHVNVLVFPELSLTGYEPTLASSLALTPDDPVLDPLAQLARELRLTVIAGAPLASATPPRLGAIVFDENGERSTYEKIHLHAGEENDFSSGHAAVVLRRTPHAIGLAICADLTHASHPAAYAALHADIYAAGVCITKTGYDADADLMRTHAAQHRLLTLLANHNAPTGGYDPAGKSAVWSPNGDLLAQADETSDALVIATRHGPGWEARVVALPRSSPAPVSVQPVGTRTPQVTLRAVHAADLPILFAHQLDPEASRMAAFPSRNREAFMAHWTNNILGNTAVISRAIDCDGRLAGHIGAWTDAETRERLVGYWIGREFWHRGVASAALSQFLHDERSRPLTARVVRRNLGSIRVLEKSGFVRSGEERFTLPDGTPEEEMIYTLIA